MYPFSSLTPRQKEIVKRSLIYAGMVITIISTVVVLIFYVMGYQFNSSDGKIEQNGLVQFESKPNGAVIAINNTTTSMSTPNKTTLTQGLHPITMKKNGYHTWQKTVDIVPGTVLWLNYARLIPSSLTPTNMLNFSTVSSSITSPDNKWMAVKENPATAAVILVSLDRDTPTSKTLTFPTDAYTHKTTDKPESFVLHSWDLDNQYMLVKHSYDDTYEWLFVNRNDETQTKNITTLLGAELSQIEFSTKNSKILYGLDGTDLRRIDLGAVTISGPLVRNVSQFSLKKDSPITYVTHFDAGKKQQAVGYLTEGASKGRTLVTYTSEQPSLHAAIDVYFGQMYVAIAKSTTLEVKNGTFSSSDSSSTPPELRTVTTLKDIGPATFMSTKTRGRFIVLQTLTGLTVYDQELLKTTKTTLVKANTPLTSEVQWLDSYTFWANIDGKLKLYEFDGANQHVIMPTVAGQAATVSPNNKYLYGFSKSDKEELYHLTRVKLIID
jgi:PEGA domain-containing protein